MGASKSAPAGGTDVCMVIPPFDQVKMPLLGPAILTAALRGRGLAVESVFGSIMLAARGGYDPYKRVSHYYLDSIIGERLFRPFGWPDAIAATLPPLPELTGSAVEVFDALEPHIAPFMDEFVAAILATRPKIVAIVSTFEQIMAGSGAAWRIKQAAPETVIVMGGANIAAPMGQAFGDIFPWVDHFFAGEADLAFPEFCETYAQTGARPADRVIACPPLENIVEASAPDYDDFMAALSAEQAAGRLPADLPESLPLESSRGCWWGMKNHCTFCGLNGDGMDFRTKPAERILGEIRDLKDRHHPGLIAMTDNIMPLSYFETVLPELAEWQDPPALFYEVKANLKYEQLVLMRDAGMAQIQPGIESLSTHVLKLMKKGISALQNLRLMRDANSLGLFVLWNILYGLPGETSEDYAALPGLIPKLTHLRAPRYCVPIVVDRYSPHHNDPESFGIPGYDPYPGFTALFPPGAPIENLAYHFIGRHQTDFMRDGDLRAAVHAAHEAWYHHWYGAGRPPRLIALPVAPGLPPVIADTRPVAVERMTRLTAAEAALLERLDAPLRTDRADPDERAMIGEFLERGFVIEHEGQYLSIVTHPAPPRRERSPEAMRRVRSLTLA